MRNRLLFLLVSLLCAVTASAQDILVKSDGTALKVKVQEISETVVKYYRHDNPTGPLYSIPISSILSITYENGSTENFGKPTTTAPLSQTSPETALTPQNSGGYNEKELYRLADKMKVLGDNNSYGWEEYMNRAKKYRKIAWYGGAAFVVAGIVTSVIQDASTVYWSFADSFVQLGLPIIGGGAIWCLAWNLAANNQVKKAKMAMAYSVPVMEWDLLKAGNNSLRASVNVMGDNMMQRCNYGLGLGLNLTF